MKNVDRLYNISNLLSFVAMTILLLDSLRVFEPLPWFNADWAFGIVAVAMCLLIVQAKRLDLKRNNPNMVIPFSRACYFLSFGSFVVGWIFLEKYSTGQVVSYGLALMFDLISSISATMVMRKMKRKIT